MTLKSIAITLKATALVLLSALSLSVSASERAEIAWQLVDKGALLVDVRTPQEFSAKHLNGAINYPLDTVTTAFKDVAKDRDIVVYCRSGNRSGQAAQYLTQSGYSRVHNGGGLNELLAAKK